MWRKRAVSLRPAWGIEQNPVWNKSEEKHQVGLERWLDGYEHWAVLVGLVQLPAPVWYLKTICDFSSRALKAPLGPCGHQAQMYCRDMFEGNVPAHTHTATVSCNGTLPHHEHDFSHLCCWSKEICRLAAQGVLQAKVIHVLLGACVCVFILKEKRWKVQGRYSLSLLRSLSTSPLSSDIRAQGKQEQTIADCNLTNPARHFMYCCAMGHSDIKSCTFF